MGHVTETLFISADNITGTADASKLMRAFFDQWGMGDNWDQETPDFDNTGFAPKMTQNAADKWISKHDRYKGAFIPVVADESATATTKKVKMMVGGQEAERLRAANGTLDYQFFEKLSDEHGHFLVSASVTKFPRQRKATAVAVEGKPVIKYEIVTVVDNTFLNSTARVVKNGFPTKAAAREEAIRLVNSDDDSERFNRSEKSLTNLAVRPYMVHEDNSAPDILIISRPTPEEVEIEVTLNFAIPKTDAAVIGWYALADRHM